jgi:hypothetical protein
MNKFKDGEINIGMTIRNIGGKGRVQFAMF